MTSPQPPAPRDVWGPPSDPAATPQSTQGWWSTPAPFAGYPGQPQPVQPQPGQPYPAAANPVPVPMPAPPRSHRTDDGIVRLAVASTLIAGVLAAVLASGATAIYERHHPETTAGSPVTLQQVGGSAPQAAAPGSVADIAAEVLPSVVTIEEKSATVQGIGSGVVIDAANGYILTNNHVVADFAADPGGGSLQVVPSGGTMSDAVTATIVGRDPSTDLAVVQVKLPHLKAATLGRSSALRVGDSVLAIGAPLGLSGTVTEGIVSYLGRNVPVPSETGAGSANELTGSIQTDAAINPGNSGGALVDSQGRVVGINSAIASTGTASSAGSQSGNIGVGFAIPIDAAAQIAAQLIQPPHTASHPYLGVRTQDNDTPPGAKLSSVDDGGSTLPAVTPNSPAARAGLREGDIITSLDASRVTGADDLLAAVRQHKVGEDITITYIRDGATRKVTVALADNTSVH